MTKVYRAGPVLSISDLPRCSATKCCRIESSDRDVLTVPDAVYNNADKEVLQPPSSIHIPFPLRGVRYSVLQHQPLKLTPHYLPSIRAVPRDEPFL